MYFLRYALEEMFCGIDRQPQWNKWDIMHLIRYLLQHGARPSINQLGNSALACVIRHVKDWDVRYELLDMLLQAGGDPGITGRDGSVPLMVCLVPLINKEHLRSFSHHMKVHKYLLLFLVFVTVNLLRFATSTVCAYC